MGAAPYDIGADIEYDAGAQPPIMVLAPIMELAP
jgi:hypothetical protein